MAAANSNIQIADLDFINIKNNLKTFLQSQDTLQDYNYEGSALSVLLDILAYNTQYNAYYLNMVANEMFLDSAIQRSSVVSHAKALGYTPKSATAPVATVNLVFNGVSSSSLTLPAYTHFISEAIDGVNYSFITIDSYTVNVSNNTATFSNVEIYQGLEGNASYTVDSTSNPTYTFEIPDSNVDTSSLIITVQQSSTNTYTQIYNLSTDPTYLTGSSLVYFLQESLTGNYEIYFGDGVIGQQLADGNIVNIQYVSTSGTTASGANNFSIMDTVSGYTPAVVQSVTAATNGSDKETIDSIKFQAPKAYSSQNRAVTKDDYITLIQQNNIGLSFDAVNVWGGEENNPPVYGRVFISLKPSGAYNITDTQKQRLINEVISPVSVLTVEPTIVDPDYTYLKITANVLYDPKVTTLTSAQIQSAVTTAINNYATNNLNTFNSVFSLADLFVAIKSADPSIISNDCSIQVQKKFFPNITNSTTYNLYYGVSLEKGQFLSGVSSSPALKFRDPTNLANIIDGMYIEEIPSSTGGVSSIQLINPGFGYQYVPTITILGDGTGATAHAVLTTSGTISSIVVDTPGQNYTSATALITPQTNDTTGQLGAAIVTLEGATGTLRLYYNNTLNVKTIFNSDIGTIDYGNGIVTLNSFGPIDVDNPLGQLTVTANPSTTIIPSSYNRIVTVDPYDSSAITVNVTAKT